MSKPKIAVIIGSTRDSRFADIPAQWILAQAKARTDMDVELVDLKSFDLPLFNEVASNAWAPSQSAAAVAWQKKIGEGAHLIEARYITLRDRMMVSCRAIKTEDLAAFRDEAAGNGPSDAVGGADDGDAIAAVVGNRHQGRATGAQTGQIVGLGVVDVGI
mgnify:CR=1 FL=1